MTTAHLAKMHAGREEANRRRMIREDLVARNWLTWNRDDAWAYHTYRQMDTTFGSGSDEAKQAYNTWRDHMARQPPLPLDLAVKRVRGEA